MESNHYNERMKLACAPAHCTLVQGAGADTSVYHPCARWIFTNDILLKTFLSLLILNPSILDPIIGSKIITTILFPFNYDFKHF